LTSRALTVGRNSYPVILPNIRDPRLHVALVVVSLQVLGQTVLHFDISIAQILIALATCAAIEVGIAGGALRDAGEFVNRARPFFEAVRGGWAQRAGDDPHTILRFGRLVTQLTAAEQLLSWAAGTLAEIGLHPADARAAARGSLAVAQAKAFGSETAVSIASELFALTGTSGTDERYDLHRHWRNSRTHSVHDPVDWKYHHVGAYALNGTLPPNHGQL